MKKKDQAVALLALAVLGGGAYIALTYQKTAPTPELAMTTVPFQKLAAGTKSTVSERVNYMISSPEGLQKLWKMVDAKGAPPVINFEKEAVIVVFAGEQSSASASISISEIQDTSTRTVLVNLAKPSSDCKTTAKEKVAPYEIAKIPATTLPLGHEDHVVVASCQ